MKPEIESPSAQKGQRRILLGQLVSYGDCLYATAIARQIKIDFPGSHLTWAISSMCRSVLNGNPYVDDIWEVRMDSIEEIDGAWHQFEKDTHELKNQDKFDEIYMTQLSPGNLQNYDGTIRSSIFRGYPNPITVPVSPVVRLSESEIENVRKFASGHCLSEKKHVILFECSPKSGQSFLTLEFAFEVARQLVSKIPNVSVILSSNLSIVSKDRHINIIDGSVLSFRENAELTKSCSLLIGCSSGISWLSTSDWAKPLPMIQLLRPDAFYLASLVQDFKRWKIPTESVLEMTNCSPDRVVRCVVMTLKEGFQAAKKLYHENIPLSYKTHGSILYMLLNKKECQKAIHFVSSNIIFHHYHPRLLFYLLFNFIKFSMDRVIVLTMPSRRKVTAFIRK